MSIGDPVVPAVGVSFPGGDGAGVVGRGTKQPVMPSTKLISNRAIMIRFILSSSAESASNFSIALRLNAKTDLILMGG